MICGRKFENVKSTGRNIFLVVMPTSRGCISRVVPARKKTTTRPTFEEKMHVRGRGGE